MLYGVLEGLRRDRRCNDDGNVHEYEMQILCVMGDVRGFGRYQEHITVSSLRKCPPYFTI